MKAAARAFVGSMVAATLACAAADAGAATFVVNAKNDAVADACGGAVGACTLRDAVTAAVATPGRDTIVFDPAVFPIGGGGLIQLTAALPVIADPAGTVLDGTGAGVFLSPAPAMGLVEPGRAVGGPPLVDGLAFASAAGVSLEGVTVRNVTLNGFTGRGLHVCGGLPPVCDQDVASTVVENVVLYGNQQTGLDIQGRTIAKTRIASTVAVNNGAVGIRIEASGSMSGTRIERSTARGNLSSGFDLHPAGDALGTVVVDTVATGNGEHGLRLLALGAVENLKVAGSVAAANVGAGFQMSSGRMVAVTVANVTASSNGGSGLTLTGSSLLSGVVVKDTVSNWNQSGIVLNGVNLVAGAKITNAKASGNRAAGVAISADDDVVDCKLSRIVAVGNGFEGVRVQGSRNVVTQVRANGNRGHGIRLDANNSGGGGNTVSKCSAFANDGHAILLNVGITQSTVQKGSWLAADGFDMRDENPCGANVWKQNVFVTRSPSCLE